MSCPQRPRSSFINTTLTLAFGNDFSVIGKTHVVYEYENGVTGRLKFPCDHLPGAKLMPLAEVETGVFSLPADRDLIFYCSNGGRSQWAASLAGESEVCQKTVFNLMGGREEPVPSRAISCR